MNTELLKAFVVVARSESLSVAAESLSKTQSTITKSVQRLEEIIGGFIISILSNEEQPTLSVTLRV